MNLRKVLAVDARNGGKMTNFAVEGLDKIISPPLNTISPPLNTISPPLNTISPPLK